MSLQLAARHLAQQGRGNDSALVHIAPKELESLQALAQKHGGSLSINPQTGLPEAGFLESLLPAVIGGGLSVASGGAIDPMTAAMLVGGGQAMLTGDLNKGLMAGIGAYGGAGMGQYMANAGSVVPAAAKDTVVQQTAAQLAPVSVPVESSIASGIPDAAQVAAAQSLPAPMNYPGGSLPPTVTAMPKDFAAFQRGFSGENALGFMKANPMQAAALASGPIMDATSKPPPAPAVDSDKGANANAGIKYNSNYINPTPAPNRYGIEQIYNRPSYMAEGGQVEHYVAGGLTPALQAYQQLQQRRTGRGSQIDTKNQFDEYMKSIRGGTVKPTLPPVPTPTPITPTQPIETSTQGGGGGGGGGGGQGGGEGTPGEGFNPTSQSAYNVSQLGQQLGYIGGPFNAYGNYLAKNVNPNYSHEGRNYTAPLGSRDVTDTDPYANFDYKTPAQEAMEAEALRDIIKETPTTPNYSTNYPSYPVAGDSLVTGVLTPNEPTQAAPSRQEMDVPEALSRQEMDVPALTPTGYTFQPNAVQDVLKNLGETPNATVDKYLADNTTAIAPTQYEGVVPASELGSQFPGPTTDPFAAETAEQRARINAALEASERKNREAEAERADAQTRQEAAEAATRAQEERAAEVSMQEASRAAAERIAAAARQEAERAAAARESLAAAERQAAERNAEVSRQEAARAQAEQQAADARADAESRDLSRSGGRDGGSDGGSRSWGGASSQEGGARGTAGGWAQGGLSAMPNPYNLGSYSDGGRLLKGPGDGVSDSIPATIGKGRPARLADGEFVIPARIVSEIGNGSTDAGARKLYAMMDRIQASRRKTVGKGKVAKNTRAEKYLPR